MSVGIAKSHFEKTIPTLGGSVLAGQLYLIEKMGSGDNVMDNVKWYNLFGDPSLLIRTDTPKEVAVSYTSTPVYQGKHALQVKVVELIGKPVAGALVSLSRNGELVASAKTDTSGDVKLQTTVGGAILLTVTGYNLGTYQKEVR